jgi:hypothetical protein
MADRHTSVECYLFGGCNVLVVNTSYQSSMLELEAGHSAEIASCIIIRLMRSFSKMPQFTCIGHMRHISMSGAIVLHGSVGH